MKNDAALVGLIAGGVVLLMLSQSAGASTAAIDWVNSTMPQPDPATTPGLDSKVSAFMAMIRQFESGNDYYIIAGGGHFSDDSTHPNIKRYLTINGQTVPTTAAGAYQINYPTFQDYSRRIGIYGFSPADQDALAYAILESTGAFSYLDRGDIEGALRVASKKWASLPYSTANQNPQSLARAVSVYESFLS